MLNPELEDSERCELDFNLNLNLSSHSEFAEAPQNVGGGGFEVELRALRLGLETRDLPNELQLLGTIKP
jgi:hypothetical protein